MCSRRLCECAVEEINRIDAESGVLGHNNDSRRGSLRERLDFWDALYYNVCAVRSAFHKGQTKILDRIIVEAESETEPTESTEPVSDIEAEAETKSSLVVTLSPSQAPKKSSSRNETTRWEAGSAMEELVRHGPRECSQIDVLTCMLHNGAWEALRECQHLRHSTSTTSSLTNNHSSETEEEQKAEASKDGSSSSEVVVRNRLGPVETDVWREAVVYAAREQFNSARTVFDPSLENAQMMLDLVQQEEKEEESTQQKKMRENVVQEDRERQLLKAAFLGRDFGCNAI